MKKETSLCMGCMADMKNGVNTESTKICAVCGYTENGVFLSSYLAPRTFLAERYIVGKLISYNGEGAYYIAFDTVSSTKVTVREYMPDTLCGRKKEEEAIEVNPQYVALYKTYLSEFIELNRSLMNIGQSLQIQRVQSVFTENNTAYAVYEYITGISLKSYLSNLGGVLPWEQVKELFTPLFTTLGIVHGAGIVHRGISPSTILFNDKNELVLINFGITAARTYGSEINHEVFAGYTAPEQYNNVERHGSWTDVYGIAAVLHKVLTGQMPPNSVSRREDDHLTEPALINRNVPQSVSAAIMKGLALDTDVRTQTVDGFIRGLFEAAPVKVPDTTHEILIKKPIRRIEDDENGHNGRASGPQGRSSARSAGRGSYALVVSGLVVLVLVVFGIMFVMFNPGMINVGDGDDTNLNNGTDPAPIGPPPDEIPIRTQPPVSEEPTQPPEPNDPLYRIPDLTERRFELIQTNVSFEFLVFNPIYEFSYEHDEGVIFEQDIEAHSDVTFGTEITLRVSMGPARVELPVYAGIKLSDYERILNDAKIKYGNNIGEFSDEVADGLVIRCRVNGDEVHAGSIIDIEKGQIVTVYYSLGADPDAVVAEIPDDSPNPGSDEDGHDE
ncbi:MAG: protein kinase [Oscillospiraceae bacterium]|nr:protein kinase [Oscillospiraceae bacterium]